MTRRHLPIAAAAAICVAAAAPGQKSSARQPKADAPRGGDAPLILVKAEVVGARADGRRVAGTLKILRVYTGPASLVGRTFAVEGTSGDDANGGAVTPPPRAKEVGLWPIREAEAGLVPSRYPGRRSLFPAREGVTPRYRQAEALADAIAEADAASGAEKARLLDRGVSSDIPEVADWSVWALAESAPDAVARLADRIVAGAEVPVAAQVAVDEVMAMRDESWPGSARRLKILKGWASGEPDDFVSVRVAERIGEVAQQSGLEDLQALELLRVVARNTAMPVEARRRAIHAIGPIARQAHAGREAFDLLAEFLGGADADLGREAAIAVAGLAPLDADRAARVRGLSGRIADEGSRALLRQALEKSEGRKP